MTWAKNHGDRDRAAVLETGKRGRKLRQCETCPSLVSGAKRFCGPCYDVRLQANIAKNRSKYKAGAQ
jgi:hypothetical protein